MSERENKLKVFAKLRLRELIVGSADRRIKTRE